MKQCPMCGYAEITGPVFVESPKKDGSGNIQALRYTCKRCKYLMHTETLEVTLARQGLALRKEQEAVEAQAALAAVKKSDPKAKGKK